MKNLFFKNKISYFRGMIYVACLVILLFFGMRYEASATAPYYYTNHVIFTAPSAEKIFDGTPLTEQIDVTAQGLPEGFTYKAVAEGSVTYPEENTENNNVVTDYIIFDPSGLNVTGRFVNVETRPGTLKVSYGDGDVLGEKRGINEPEATDEEHVTDIDEEEVPLASMSDYTMYGNLRYGLSLETFVYGILFVIMIMVFIAFIMDSNR